MMDGQLPLQTNTLVQVVDPASPYCGMSGTVTGLTFTEATIRLTATGIERAFRYLQLTTLNVRPMNARDTSRRAAVLTVQAQAPKTPPKPRARRATTPATPSRAAAGTDTPAPDGRPAPAARTRRPKGLVPDPEPRPVSRLRQIHRRLLAEKGQSR